MYLKTLTIRGFKSFATATTLRFEPGITSIVGPNGSGKSNIVDALTWVMGEQGAKSLRGANMADVIFAGTSGKPALGRARVELTIDNADGRLPIEYAEVTIARTLFRGGGSEYTINGAPARLLDVQELLSDAGMGKQMHVIVGQGQLDAVLRATPEERREFIDEAAGVLKHRRRKERALRKLGAMDADLLRVVDLTDELTRQLRPLARQAKEARAARSIHQRVAYAEKRLAVDALLEAEQKLELEERQAVALREQYERQALDSATAESDLEQAELMAAQKSRELDSATELAHQFDSLQERFNSIHAIASERSRQLGSGPVGPSEAAVSLAAEKLAESRQETSAFEEQLRLSRVEVSSREEDRRQAAHRQSTLQADVDKEQKRLDELRGRQARLREERVRRQSAADVAKVSLRDCEVRYEESALRLKQLEEKVVQLHQDGEEALKVERLLSAHKDAERAVNTVREELELAQSQQREKEAEQAKWQARTEALSQSLQQVSRSKLETGSDRTLDEALRIAPGWENAVSALLGPLESALLVGEDYWEELRSDPPESSYYAAVLAGDTSAAPYPSFRSEVDEAGCPATQVLVGSGDVDAALRDLLAGDWLAPTPKIARSLLSGDDSVNRVALPDGTVYSRTSVMNTRGPAPSPLLLRSQAEQAKEEAQRARQQAVDAQQLADLCRKRLVESSALAAQNLTLLREAEREEARAAQQHSERAAQLAGQREEVRKAAREAERARQRAADTLSALQDLEEDTEEDAREPHQTLLELRNQLETATVRINGARDEELAAKLRLGVAEERLRAAQRQEEAFRARFEQLKTDRAEGQVKEERRKRELTLLQEAIGRAAAARDQAKERALVARERCGTLRAESTRLEQSRRDLQESVQNLRWQQTTSSERKQQIEVAIAGSKMRSERAREDLLGLLGDEQGEELTEQQLDEQLQVALHEAHPSQPVVLDDGSVVAYSKELLEKQLKKAQKELSKLGVVNPLAVAEYEALQTRLQFLKEQVADLRASKKDLLDIIADVDQRIRVAFEEAFADTQRYFGEVFATLFPGGTGKLSLTDPDDPLSTGVEIYARPAGKRVTRLSLLSGGERSLAALAYLVAIFRARPSPFYVMDEVEAALDDLNLSRVLRVMEQLRADSQLIVVTHQKRTMEIADALYGVTMSGGTSKVISHRL